jgi:hypothetical protein
VVVIYLINCDYYLIISINFAGDDFAVGRLGSVPHIQQKRNDREATAAAYESEDDKRLGIRGRETGESDGVSTPASFGGSHAPK